MIVFQCSSGSVCGEVDFPLQKGRKEENTMTPIVITLTLLGITLLTLTL